MNMVAGQTGSGFSALAAQRGNAGLRGVPSASCEITGLRIRVERLERERGHVPCRWDFRCRPAQLVDSLLLVASRLKCPTRFAADLSHPQSLNRMAQKPLGGGNEPCSVR